jgi:hypothetical protein
MYEKECSNLKEQNKRVKKRIPLKIEESSNLRLLVENNTSTKIFASFRRKQGSGEKLLRCKLSIYRGEGVVSRKLPRYDRCEKSGGRVSTPTFRG